MTKHFIQSFSLCLGVILITFSSQAQNTKVPPSNYSIRKGDSLFLARDYKNAKLVYEKVLKDTSRNATAWTRLGFSNYMLGQYDVALKSLEKSLTQKPIRPVKANTFASLARIHAIKNERQKALVELDSAITAGYSNLRVLDTLADFQSLRGEAAFKKLRDRVYAAAYPCMVNPQARLFDFWIGDWDVYVTGTKNYAGHNVIQSISRGCALLENWDNTGGSGKSINYIDPVTNKWKQAWAGSGGIQEFVNGEYKDGAMRFEFETANPGGPKILGRFIFYNEKPGQVRQFNEVSADGGKTWTTQYDFTYILKK